jgi:hypothetical protein
MTSIIQCFPQFYDVREVHQCCATAGGPQKRQQQQHWQQQQQQSTNRGAGALFALTKPPVGMMPQQCLTLCTADFRYHSLTHFTQLD